MGTEADYLIDQNFDRKHGEYGNPPYCMKCCGFGTIRHPKTEYPYFNDVQCPECNGTGVNKEIATAPLTAQELNGASKDTHTPKDLMLIRFCNVLAILPNSQR